MVLQLAVAVDQLSKFYGAVVEESPKKPEPSAKKWTTQELFGCQKIVIIEHEDAQYRLMITKQGKLVLNK